MDEIGGDSFFFGTFELEKKTPKRDDDIDYA